MGAVGAGGAECLWAMGGREGGGSVGRLGGGSGGLADGGSADLAEGGSGGRTGGLQMA